MIEVFRVEMGDGNGPYDGGVRLRQVPDADFFDLQPPPFTDGIKDFEPFHFFGFSSFSAFFRWFGHTLDILEQKGCVLCRYLVDSEHVISGKRQVVFVKDNATLIEKIPIEVNNDHFRCGEG